MSENKHTPAITGFDAEFLSKRLGRVCARLGIAQPFGDNHESNAEVAGTTLAAVDRAIESLVKQRDDLLAALERAVQSIIVFRNEQTLARLGKLRASVGYLEMQRAMDDGKEIIASVKGEQTLTAPQVSAPLFVRVSEMRESNGRATWSVFLAKSPDAAPWGCHQVYSDAIEGRARYEAAVLAHFLGLGPAPDILAFDTDPVESKGGAA